MPYLTPDSNPTTLTCRVLLFPDSDQWAALVNGALQELTYLWNFEQFGAVTPEQCVERFQDMCDRLAYRQGVCRVVGEIILYAGASSPDARWLPCNGASILRADYPDLFIVIGTTYGAVDSSHFNVPDLQNRVPMGVGTNALGATLGEASHTLTTGEMPSHNHSEGTTIPTATFIGEIPSATIASSIGSTGFAGGGGAHNNIQPSLAMNYLIVALS